MSRFKLIDYSYFNSCSIFKTPITQIAKSPVLRAVGNDNSKSRVVSFKLTSLLQHRKLNETLVVKIKHVVVKKIADKNGKIDI